MLVHRDTPPCLSWAEVRWTDPSPRVWQGQSVRRWKTRRYDYRPLLLFLSGEQVVFEKNSLANPILLVAIPRIRIYNVHLGWTLIRPRCDTFRIFLPVANVRMF